MSSKDTTEELDTNPEDEVSSEETSENTLIAPLDMSDEAFLKSEAEGVLDTLPEKEEISNTDLEEVGADSEEDDDIDDEDSTDIKEDSGNTSKEVEDTDEEKDLESDEVDKAASETNSDSEKESKVDKVAEYNKLLQPFNANGKQMQVDSVDDAITLMKMGANYNKKMAGLKPSLRILKMLENNDLLDESKLTFLIDLDKKNPDAVAKYLSDASIDPMDIDTDKAGEYIPNTYTVKDEEVYLGELIKDIGDDAHYNKTVEVITNKWDSASKNILLENPNSIRILHEQVGNGIFDTIMDVVEKEKMLGRLGEFSDLEAYRHVGDLIQKNGGFNQQGNKSPTADESAPTTISKAKAEDPLRKKRKQAAAPTKQSKQKAEKAAFNPLAMSDEEIEKVGISAFM